MTKSILTLLSVVALAGGAAAEVAYEFVPNFITPPPGKETIGNGHGEIAVDSSGKIYVSVQEANAGVQVYGTDGKFIKALPLPQSLHGFVIRKDGDGEFIYEGKPPALLGDSQSLTVPGVPGVLVMCDRSK